MSSSPELSPPCENEEVGRLGQTADSAGANQKPRLEDFRANNYNSVNNLTAAHVTHVLCCPECAFMSLQEEALAMHAMSLHSIACLTVHRCGLCQAASTQRDIMMEHISIYHGMHKESEILSQLVTSSVQCPATSAPLTGSKKRKSNIPERIDQPQQQQQPPPPRTPDPCAKRSRGHGLLLAAAVAPLDLSVRKSPSAAAAAAADLLKPLQPLQPLAVAEAAAGAASSQEESDVDPETPHQQQPRLHRGKPQRQNFTDSQNRQLQSWFSQHRTKPYPSTADTKSLAEATGLNYSQVKKWFANRRMRTKTPRTAAESTSLLLRDGATERDLSSGLASPCSQWSASEFAA